MIERALSLATVIARWGVRGGGLLMLAAAILVSVDVIMRRLLNMTTGGADELSGYAFAIGGAWSFAFVTLSRINVRVDALYMHLPQPVAAVLDFLSLVALGTFGVVIARYGFDVFASSWQLSARSNSALAVPLWIPQLFWWLGLLLFVVTLALLMMRSVSLLVRRDWPALQRLIGARSVLEEAESETAYARDKQPVTPPEAGLAAGPPEPPRR